MCPLCQGDTVIKSCLPDNGKDLLSVNSDNHTGNIPNKSRSKSLMSQFNVEGSLNEETTEQLPEDTPYEPIDPNSIEHPASDHSNKLNKRQ